MELDEKLKEFIREKKLKHKYSRNSGIRKIADSLEPSLQSKEMKRNLLITNLRSEKVPYKFNPVISTNKKARNVHTAAGLPDISEDFLIFRSEAS